MSDPEPEPEAEVLAIARTGRHRQRYDNHFRLVSGCIPYRVLIDENEVEHPCDIHTKIQVLMVSSPNRDDLVFPKGGWEDDETILEAACREALEEAGVRGKLNENPLGVWEFRSKSRQDICSMEGACRGYMFALEVTEELQAWPEQGNRQRKWLNVKDASRLCRYEWMRMALETFLRVMTEDENIESTKEIAETTPAIVADVVDCQMVTSNGCARPPFSQQHVGSCNQSLVGGTGKSFNFEKEQAVK